MKQHYGKWLVPAMVAAAGLALANSTQAQNITGGQYLSIDPSTASFTGDWNSGNSTATPTGLEIIAAGGTGSFSTLYYSIPGADVIPNSPDWTQVQFNFTINSGTFAGPVNVLFALDDSDGGVNYYATGYTISAPGAYSQTFSLQSPNQGNVQSGAVINGLNLQLDPANVSGNYDITFNSIVMEPAPVPEPAPMALMGLGAFGLWWMRRRK